VKKRMSLALVAGGLMAAMLPGAVAAQDDQDEGVSLLFVASAASGNVEGDTLTLDAVPAVLWFADRPDRGAGHIEPSDLADLWTDGADSFADDPPNAVLSLLDEDTIADAVIELTDITADGVELAFTFELLDGELLDGPLGTASLFIDGSGTTNTGDMNSGNVNTGDYNSGHTSTGNLLGSLPSVDERVDLGG